MTDPQRISALSPITEAAATDSLVIVDVPNVPGGTKKVTVTSLLKSNLDADLAALTTSNTLKSTKDTVGSPTTALTGAIFLKSQFPRITFQATGAAADNGVWSIVAAVDQLKMEVFDDIGTTGGPWMTVDRTLNVLDLVEFFGPVKATYLQTEVTTTAALDAVGNAINTAVGKVDGAMLFNTTTNKPVWAVGNTDGAVWVDATGATAHTPV